MNAFKRAAAIASVAVLSTLATTICLASVKYSTTRNIVAGDTIRLFVKHNTSAATTGDGEVVSNSGGTQFLRAILINGSTANNSVSVTGLNANGNPVTNCNVQVSGPLPKDPGAAICSGAVTYLTVVTAPE